jgi:hypothetical protein
LPLGAESHAQLPRTGHGCRNAVDDACALRRLATQKFGARSNGGGVANWADHLPKKAGVCTAEHGSQKRASSPSGLTVPGKCTPLVGRLRDIGWPEWVIN